MSEPPQEPLPEKEGAAEADLIQNRANNLNRIRELADVYPFSYPMTDTVSDVVRRHGATAGEDLEKLAATVRTAGRILAQRNQGKAGFLDLSDGTSRLQVYVRKDVVGEKGWELFRALDLGDWIGVEGELFRTRTGELSVKARVPTFLAKCLRPLPEKWHGLKDVERRYRERQQLRRIPGRDIEDDQLADDGQQRDQDHGADLYDALRSLGHEQEGSLELERDNHREDHSKHALE